MKILFTGGATGGHFYPIIAIAKELQKILDQEKVLGTELYFMGPSPYDERVLFESGITYLWTPSGKLRRYFSIKNFFDLFKTFFGVLRSIYSVLTIYPDVVVGKGGYGSFPALFAARLFGIPVIIHESDSRPGRVNSWAGKFAKRIAISFPEAAEFFPPEKTALTGCPIREELLHPIEEGAHEFLKLERMTPVILVLGGSQGAKTINDALLDALPKLVEKWQIVHQTGPENFSEVSHTAEVILEQNPHKNRYIAYPYLNLLALRMSYGVASAVISRAGSTIFELAASGIPSIIIPIPEEVSHDQTSNAFAYARAGAAIVIEQKNLTPNILFFELQKIIEDKEARSKLEQGAKAFATPDAAKKIAEEIYSLASTHYS